MRLVTDTSTTDSSLTFAVVFSTLVAHCGSFYVGCIVSTSRFSMTIETTVSFLFHFGKNICSLVKTKPMSLTLMLYIALQTGYSSPAQSGIMKDFGLSVAAVFIYDCLLSFYFFLTTFQDLHLAN
ncbi:hypothetical protein PanWU01x14_124720 [Parasponia andersonii]|uniref:Uncharacterized protein n=1 Tax=Parasponia andersonii TaxID=3476 RepID=A0A2P5CTM2_PARAD|nr:hypothetical protein PanWU01x14_124720 [Parasponia andersonii]